MSLVGEPIEKDGAAEVRFEDRGEFVAKGFEEPVQVYEAGWRE